MSASLYENPCFFCLLTATDIQVNRDELQFQTQPMDNGGIIFYSLMLKINFHLNYSITFKLKNYHKNLISAQFHQILSKNFSHRPDEVGLYTHEQIVHIYYIPTCLWGNKVSSLQHKPLCVVIYLYYGFVLSKTISVRWTFKFAAKGPLHSLFSLDLQRSVVQQNFIGIYNLLKRKSSVGPQLAQRSEVSAIYTIYLIHTH